MINKKDPVLVIIKPDGMNKNLQGMVLDRFAQEGLELIAIKLYQPLRKEAEKHYLHIQGKPFFEKQIEFFLGGAYKQKHLLFMVYYGENAVKRSRALAGATNPEEAKLSTIRGAYGRITTKDIYENVIHVSSDKKEAEREIKLWFTPDEIIKKLFVKKIKR